MKIRETRDSVINKSQRYRCSESGYVDEMAANKLHSIISLNKKYSSNLTPAKREHI